MRAFEEPEDVDFVVTSGLSSPEMAHATGEWIKAYQLRAEARDEAGIAEADALMEHWATVIEDLDRAEGESEGRPAAHSDPAGAA